jgi:hypothetical protein
MDERGTPLPAIDTGRVLYEGGYGLDSLDTATLSAMLAEQFENDPYTSGTFPRNIADIIAYYSAGAIPE